LVAESQAEQDFNPLWLSLTIMARRHPSPQRVTLALRLADGSLLPVEASADAMCFIGRYCRLSAFGPLGTRLKAHVVMQR
jgi:hypothetical protein